MLLVVVAVCAVSCIVAVCVCVCVCVCTYAKHIITGILQVIMCGYLLRLRCVKLNDLHYCFVYYMVGRALVCKRSILNNCTQYLM